MGIFKLPDYEASNKRATGSAETVSPRKVDICHPITFLLVNPFLTFLTDPVQRLGLYFNLIHLCWPQFNTIRDSLLQAFQGQFS